MTTSETRRDFASTQRRTKIVATLGPSALSGDTLERLMAAGVDCVRLNFSHGSHADHLDAAKRVRQIARELNRAVSILADLQGPKIRVGVFEGGPVELVSGQEFTLTSTVAPCTSERACVSYPHLAEDLRPGDPVLIDDGLLGLRVLRIEGSHVVCRVETGGTISDRKGVNLPGAKLRASSLADKDKTDLAFIVTQIEADYVALSFVRSAKDILELKALAPHMPVIAKLEKPEAMDNLKEIVAASDGVMVARGDLGVELGAEKVPMWQKRIIREANRRGKLVITATQMLDSMIRNPRPTRAEAADVANAILDGTDAIMLSGETASGRYPLESVKMMNAIALEAETGLKRNISEHYDTEEDWELASAAARAAANLTQSLKLAAIVVFTSDGRSAELLANYRPKSALFAVAPDHRIANHLALHWGVRASVHEPVESIEDAVKVASRILRGAGVLVGSPFALVVGIPMGSRTNCVLLQTVA